jgi:hypothetical protein
MLIYFGGCLKKGFLQKPLINYSDCIDLKVEYQTRPSHAWRKKKPCLAGL